MNRREFVKGVAAGLVVGPMLAQAEPSKLPQRTLGRTGIQVSIIGFGSGSRFLMYKEDDKAWEALNRAIDLGINYIDTAAAYGDGKSESLIGKVMATRRKEVTLATKIPGRTAEQARREIELSLKRLQTDHLDVLHIHNLKDSADIAAIEAKGGVLEALYEAREKKITRAIGVTCHSNPAVLKAILERHDFDCTQMALNAGLARMADLPGGMKATSAGPDCFERLALPVAVRKKMGIIAMKVFGQEQLVDAAPIDKLLAYALSLPISLASLGMPRLEHISHNVELARTNPQLSAQERKSLSETVSAAKKTAMLHFLSDHEDV